MHAMAQTSVYKYKNIGAPNAHCQHKPKQQRRQWHKSFIIEIVLCARNVFT